MMRLMSAAAAVYLLALTFAASGAAYDDRRAGRDGQRVFRYDTFGDEQLWTDVLRMHEVLPAVDPATALAVGLKVDVEALPSTVIDALRARQVDLTSPA